MAPEAQRVTGCSDERPADGENFIVAKALEDVLAWSGIQSIAVFGGVVDRSPFDLLLMTFEFTLESICVNAMTEEINNVNGY